MRSDFSIHTRGHSDTCGVLLRVLHCKVSEFRFGSDFSILQVFCKEISQMTSLRSRKTVRKDFTRHLQLYNVKKKKKRKKNGCGLPPVVLLLLLFKEKSERT